jgi:hypothetical protein
MSASEGIMRNRLLRGLIVIGAVCCLPALAGAQQQILDPQDLDERGQAFVRMMAKFGFDLRKSVRVDRPAHPPYDSHSLWVPSSGDFVRAVWYETSDVSWIVRKVTAVLNPEFPPGGLIRHAGASWWRKGGDEDRTEAERGHASLLKSGRTGLSGPFFETLNLGGTVQAYWFVPSLGSSRRVMLRLKCGALTVSFEYEQSLGGADQARQEGISAVRSMAQPLYSELQAAKLCVAEAPPLELDFDSPLEATLDASAIALVAGGPTAEVRVLVVGGTPDRPLTVDIGPVDITVSGQQADDVQVVKGAETRILDGDVRAVAFTVSASSRTPPGLTGIPIRVREQGGGDDRVTLWVAVNRPPEAYATMGAPSETTQPITPPIVAKRDEPPTTPPVVAKRDEPPRDEALEPRLEEFLARAQAMQAGGDAVGAQAELSKALDAGPPTPALFARVALFHVKQQDWMAARFAWREAIRLAPKEPRYRAEMGLALLRLGDREAALQEAQEALRLGFTPADHPVFAELGIRTP